MFEEEKIAEAGADIERIEIQGEKLTLVQRIERLPLKAVKSVSYQPYFQEEFCIICGKPRIDSDPTGATCNNPKCLAELWKEYRAVIERAKEAESEIEDVKNSLVGLVKKLGLEENELSNSIKEICEEIEEKCEEIEEKIEKTKRDSENTKADLAEIAEKLGLNSGELPEDDIEKVCHIIDNGVNEIGENLKAVIEDTLGVDLSSLSADNLPTLLGVISKELEAIKKAVEKKEQKTNQ